MTALQLAADILAGVFLCLLFAAVYVSVKIHSEEKFAGEQKRREVFMDEFRNGDIVKIKLNGAIGSVAGVGDFKASGRQYSVEYALSGGEIKIGWFLPDEIQKEGVPA